MKTGREVGNKPLVLRPIHSTGFVVARSTRVGYQGCDGPGGSPISPASTTSFLVVSTFPVTQFPR